MVSVCRPIEAVLEVEAPVAPAQAAADAEPAQQDDAQPLSDEIVMNDAGKPLNAVPSARGADESAKGCLMCQPSLCQQVPHAMSPLLFRAFMAAHEEVACYPMISTIQVCLRCIMYEDHTVSTLNYALGSWWHGLLINC